MPGVKPATDLVERAFRPAAPNVLWVADITYLRTGEGWLHLAAVQDAHSRQIVGWSMATHMRSTLVVDALEIPLCRRRPGPGLIHQPDPTAAFSSRPSQLLSIERCDDRLNPPSTSASPLAAPRARPGSRSRWGDVETPTTTRAPRRPSATLKKELVNRRTWPSRLELQSAVFEYIEAFYDRRRRHSTLNMLSPSDYERLSQAGG